MRNPAAWGMLLTLTFVGCEEGPPTRAELDAIAAMQRVHGHFTTDDKGHAVNLVLAGEQIHDDDLAPLAQLPDLSYLNLANTQITDDALVHLSSLTNLKQLSLRATKVTDAGLAHLKGLKSLEEIDLEQVKIGLPGLKNLAALPALRKIYVGPGGPSTGDVDVLKSINPRIHVFRK